MVHNRCVAWTAVVIAASCFWSGSNVSWAAGKAEEGFVSLFDGKTLDGWHLMNGAQFVAQDGVLKLNGGRGWLRSDKEYSDFILRLEFRFMKPDQDGGVFLRSNMEGDDWPSRKYEVQCQNTARMGMIFGAAHDLNVELTQKTLKPVGEWNEYEITLVKSSVEVRLNGEVVSVSASMDKLTRGYLGLQGENGFHEYRNIRIKDLGRTEEGFVSLFDGKTLDGWHLMNGAQFVAQDGVLKLNGGRGWLRSDKEYSDFILRLEFRFMKPDQDGGVFLRSNMEGDDWPSRKYEVQCQNTARMGTIFGAAHDLNVELTQKTLKPVGEWNEYEITLVKSSVEVRLNGEVVSVSASMDKLTRGYLGLQGENGFHEYRNIRIKDLGRTEEGFVSLFDGKTLDGWHLMNGAQFVAQDGVLKLNGGHGWLRSDKEYSDFILRLEFRFMKPDQDGGVFLRSNMEGDDWPSRKYEVQCQNTARMGMIFGAAHDLNVELTQKTLKPVGEWNEYEITLVKSSVEVRLNGEVVSVSASMDKLTRGYLGLQGENGFHEYRNIRIKDLGK